MQNSGAKLFSFAKLAHHNPWLDLLWTIAIFLVLLRHGSRFENNGLSDGFLANLFKNGWVGVDLFFVLAGYLIACALIRRSKPHGGFFPKGYFKDRILRIVPTNYAVLLNARLSYTLYLVHFPLLPLAFALSDQQHYLVFWTSYLVLSFALALVMHFDAEKPFFLLKQTLNQAGRPIAVAERVRAALS